jgi:DNA-binding GntR family transcriptional regulator
MPIGSPAANQKIARRKNGGAAIHNLVYQEIRHSLMAGAFVPGEKVSLRSLAQQVGTSLTPVRGAVNRLIAEGAFEVLPNRWVMIPPMTEEKFEEITHWRVHLETEATRRAARYISKSLLKEIAAINQRMIKAVLEKGDRHDILAGNYEFHFAIYRASRSTILLPMIESLWLQVGPFTYYSLLSPRELWDAKYHEAIIGALKDGDGETAAIAIKNDILNTANFLKINKQYSQPKLRRVVD